MDLGSICAGENATTYLRSEGARLMEFATHTIKNVTLNMCADACTSKLEGHECSSFEYDARSQECSMHVEDGQPFGPSVLTKTDGPVAFFQQMCVRGDVLCSTPYGFERFPQSMLIGHAMKVISVAGLSECLSQCLTAPASHQTQCRSVMFFYETGECILNRERRTDRPELFVEGVQEQLVDYFENNCQDVRCYVGQLHWIRTEDYFISHEKDVIIESMSLEECKAVCQGNLIGSEKFPCRAFVFNAAKKECHLTAESGYTGRRGNAFNLNPISSGEYFEKYCLQVPFTCLETSFEQVPEKRMASTPYREFASTSVHSCLAGCLDDGAQCATAVFNYEKDLCSLSETSQFSHPELFIPGENMDYFDKICDPAPVARQRLESSSSEREPVVEGVAAVPLDGPDLQSVDEDRVTSLGLADIDEVSKAVEYIQTSTPMTPDLESNVIARKETQAEGIVIDDTADFVKEQQTPVKAQLTSECRMSGVTIRVEFAAPISGAIYVKEKFATCRSEFINTTVAELHIPLPRSDDVEPRCPGIEIAPALWSFQIGVQKNDIDAPSLVTSIDRVFNVTCDYADLIENGSPIPPTDNEIDEAKSARIEMQILRNGEPVTTVPLGEVVELRWRILDPSNGLGYFIETCVAERVGGAPPQPEPLTIIQHGCPDERTQNRLIKSPVSRIPDGFTTKMKVFRFDGSRRVRIRCTIDVCIDRCAQVTCDGLENGSAESFGRRKRNSQKTPAEGSSRRFKPNFATASTREGPVRKRVVTSTITITDVEKKTHRKRPEFSAMPIDQFCLMRSHVVAAVVAFSVLSITQLFILLNCLHSRCAAVPDNVSCSSTGSSSYMTRRFHSSSIQDIPTALPPVSIGQSSPSYDRSLTSR